MNAPSSPILVEACVDSVESAIAAERGGAHRLELCDALVDGGTTPSAGMIAAVKAAVRIPVFVILRPRGGGFVYSDAEVDVMRRDAEVAASLGADGLVIGLLQQDARLDVRRTRALIDASRPVDPSSPTVLLYEPDDAGGLKLLGAEFLQPDVGQPTTTLEGEPFDGPMPGHTAGMPVHYDLHVWTDVANPSGVFAPWNPKVTC